jgi:hypothetical protein
MSIVKSISNPQKNIISFTQTCKQIVCLHNFSLKNVKGCYQKCVQISTYFCANFKISVQISTFKIKSFIFPFQCIITSIRKLRIKIYTISNNLRPFVRLNNNPLKSFKQMKFSCAKVCKFQHFLP